MPTLTPARRRFLEAAVAAGGEIRRDRGHIYNRAVRFHAGGINITENSAGALIRDRLIEQVEPIRDHGALVGIRYRLTPAGRAAVAREGYPSCDEGKSKSRNRNSMGTSSGQ